MVMRLLASEEMDHWLHLGGWEETLTSRQMFQRVGGQNRPNIKAGTHELFNVPLAIIRNSLNTSRPLWN